MGLTSSRSEETIGSDEEEVFVGQNTRHQGAMEDDEPQRVPEPLVESSVDDSVATDGPARPADTDNDDTVAGSDSAHQARHPGQCGAAGADHVVDLDVEEVFDMNVDANAIVPAGIASQGFLVEVENAVRRAEGCIKQEQFGLTEARSLIETLRDIVQRHTVLGVTQFQLEDFIHARAMMTACDLINGVQDRQVEVYDPRQTLVYMFCVMSIFPRSIQLQQDPRGRGLLYVFSAHIVRECYDLLPELTNYCQRKTEWEGANATLNARSPQNAMRHQQLLLDLALWLERDRPVVAFLMMSEGFLNVRNMLVALRNARRCGMITPGASASVDNLQWLLNASDIIKASCLVRAGFLDETQAQSTYLRKVNATTLPPRLAARFAFVQASLLLHVRMFDRALERAQDALRISQGTTERREMEQLKREIETAITNAATQHNPAHLDEEWLQDTNVSQTRVGARQQQEARQKHHKKPRHSRPRRASPDTRSQTSSRSSSSTRHRHTSGNLPGVLPITHARDSCSPGSVSSACSSSTFSLSTYGSSPGSSAPRITLSRDVLQYSSDLDDELEDSDDEVDDRGLAFDYSAFYDSDDETNSDGESEITTVAPRFRRARGESEETEEDWFDRSVRAVENGEADHSLETEIQLSDNQYEFLNKGGRGQAFYPDVITNEGQLEALLQQDPARFKRCQLKIESSHRSFAKILTKDSVKYSEIFIMGRSKCGRTYMDDEVVVEVLAEPGQNKGLQTKGKADKDQEALEHMAFGQVVGVFLSKRVNYANIDHPVLFCTVDELEGHLMKPLCKTVPKIHVMNDKVKKNFPALVKNRIEIKKISAQGDVEHKGYFNIEPDKREQYVFRVAILAWRQQNIYPLGAVLDAHVGGKDYSSGLDVLKLQQRVPELYPEDAVLDTQRLLQEAPVLKNGRLDLTDKQVFTIDPPGSKDLDDAVSVWPEGPHHVVGVHIADVSAVVQEGSPLDNEAKKRSVTFYPLNRRPHPMLPEPLSHNRCSLLEGKERPALSIFFKFNTKGKQVSEPILKKTVIKSTKQLTYKEAQRVIEDDPTGEVSDSIREDIKILHNIARSLREGRFQKSMLYVPFEDPRLKDFDDIQENQEAHALIEEYMVLANSYVAKRLAAKDEKFRNVMILRCHKAPTYEELREWREKEGSVANLVMQLQGKKVSPSTQLAVEAHSAGAGYQKQIVLIQEELWERLRRHIEEGEVEEARRLAFMDDLHPLQCLANNHWMDLMETAQYKCAHGLNLPDYHHFGLNLDFYTHFTSPIRRYADLHVHRLLHADLEGRVPSCTPDDVTRLCAHINSATARQKAFGKGCLALKIADSLQRQPLVFRTYVDKVDSEQLTLMVPSLRAVSDRKQELPFSILGVHSQPEVVTDTAQKQDYVNVEWSKRIYNEHGTCPGDFKVKREAMERKSGRGSSKPLIMDLNPHQYSVNMKQSDWADILKALAEPQNPARDGIMANIPLPLERNKLEVNYMSSESGDGTVSLRSCQFKMVYSPGQVLRVQMSAEPKRGVLQPRTDLLHTARNSCVCTQHVRDPVGALTRHATRTTREQQFTNYKDYVRAWMPLLEMEAALGAGGGDDVVIVENVPVLIQPLRDDDDSNGRNSFTGSFSLNAKFCFDRCIEFGGKSPDSIREDKSSGSSHAFPLDYLCIRHRTECPGPVTTRVRESSVPEAVDRHYTWVGHAGVVAAKHKGRKEEDGGRLQVTFVLSSSTPPPPEDLMKGQGGKVTIEILPKSAVDRRAQQMLLSLDTEGCELAQAIAYGTKTPKLEKERLRLGHRDENHEVLNAGLPRNNVPQLDAIKTALTHSVSLIQGPPGTGKTYTGIKLVYLFCKINRQLEKEGKGKKTVLFCGPSNKSVDLVARLLKQRLGSDCPKMVRVYGSAIESKDYPVPRGNLRSTRGMRDLQSDPELQDVTLHHIIRESGKPYAEKLAEFESFFQKCRLNPELYKVDSKGVKLYRKLLHKASVEELRNYEVVLTTCAVGGNRRLVEGTEGNIYQVMIDECAMSPEPHSLVPIIATKAKQVVLIGDHKQLRPIITCQAAADLGLDQSLFERLYKIPSSKRVFLDTQYRMHPQICEFPSNEFYDGRLKTGYSKLWSGDPLPLWPTRPWTSQQVPHILVDVRGEEETLTVTTDQGNERSKSNVLEADKVIEIFTYLKREHGTETSHIKVLTQYNAQRHLIDEKLKKLCGDRSQSVFDRYDVNKINVSTVVSSQGGEWDYVILSTVRSLPSYKIEPHPTHGWCRQNLGFITDKNQVNVALTRARKGIIIVGNQELLRCDDVWRHLMDRYETLTCVKDAADFPPPPAPRGKQGRRHGRPLPSLEWQQM